jgi:hypothetical protein
MFKCKSIKLLSLAEIDMCHGKNAQFRLLIVPIRNVRTNAPTP